MAKIRLIRHVGVPKDCGSYEVRVEGLRPRFYYWDDAPSRRLRPEQMDREQALEMAKSLARGLSMTR